MARPDRVSGLLVFLLVFLSVPLLAGSKADKLPSPLTLQHALKHARNSHPTIEQARAEIDRAASRKDKVKSDYGLTVTLEGRALAIDPVEVATNQETDDSRAGIVIRKRLFDFGRKKARQLSAQYLVQSRRLLLGVAVNIRRIRIMAAYFNVVLADIKYMRDNEAMAVAYVRYDRLKTRHKLGQVSDVTLLEAEARYQRMRRVRYSSDVNRRITREKLANMMNRPGELSLTLERPDLPDVRRKLPDMDDAIRKALQHNVELRALHAELKSARMKIRAARRGRLPVIDGHAYVTEYEREIGNRNNSEVGVTLQIPLFTGGRVKAAVSKAAAEYRGVQARLRAKQLEIRRRVVELHSRLYVLKAQLDEAKALRNYRDLKLDFNRAQYELDVRATLGDAMALQTGARFQKLKAEYLITLAWAQLDAIRGRRVFAPDRARVKTGSRDKMAKPAVKNKTTGNSKEKSGNAGPAKKAGKK